MNYSVSERIEIMNTRMNRSRLNIGTFILQPYARSEQHIKDLSDAHVDFVLWMANDRPALDLMEKYGVGAIVKYVVPNWWGGDGEKAGRLEELNPISAYEAAAASFVDHPAVWGIDVGDEPSALDFPYYSRLFPLVERLFPEQFAYLNLYPNYASVSQNNAEETVNQLGTETYEEHIQKYCECVPADYLSYDFYPYSINITKHYENLRVVANACRETGRSMWIVLQVNSDKPAEWTSENRLRFQAYTSMAFGAECIMWACYTAGWWYNQVLDGEGNKTEQYEKMKTVNRELRTLGEDYMRFYNVSTHFVGFAGHPDMEAVKAQSIPALNTGVFFDLHAEGGAPLVVGQMASRSRDGAVALMICAADDPYDKNPAKDRIVFRVANGKAVHAVGGRGRLPLVRESDGRYAVEIASNEGVLIIAE